MTESRRVLVIDDDESVRQMLVSLLHRLNLVVDVAVNGREALERIRQNVYAVVLLDLIMPDLDGFAVLDALGSSPSPPVVLVVTGAEPALVDRLDTKRIHGIVRKPFDPDDLASLVTACAEIKSRGGLEAMAISAMLAGAPLLAFLSRFGG